MESGHFHEYSVQNTRKKDFAVFFLLDTLKTTSLMENLIQRWILWGPFFKIRALFPIFKKRYERPPPVPLHLHAWFYKWFYLFFTISVICQPLLALCKKWSFPLRISSVNATKSAGKYRFGHIYWRNP